MHAIDTAVDAVVVRSGHAVHHRAVVQAAVRAALVATFRAELTHMHLDGTAGAGGAGAVVVAASADGKRREALIGGDLHQAHAAFLRQGKQEGKGGERGGETPLRDVPS